MALEALGMVETRGLTAAIEAADSKLRRLTSFLSEPRRSVADL